MPSLPGFFTSTTGVSKDWWTYTAAFGGVFPFDSALFFAYNSRFVSGVGAADQPPCSSAALPSPAAGNYYYLCNTAYDAVSQGVEFPTSNSLADSFTAA